MPQPNPGAGFPDPLMQNIAIGYTNAEFIGERALQELLVENESGLYPVFPRGAWFRDEAAHRGPGSAAPRSGYTVSTGTYKCINKAIAKEVTDEERNNPYQAVLMPDIRAAQFCSNAIRLHIERLVATLFLTAANWASGHTEDATGGWAAGSGNTFLTDVFLRRETIREAIGRYPNVMIIDSVTMKELQQEATLLDRIKYTQKAVFVGDLVASLFELDELLVGKAIYSTADEKADGTDFSSRNIWETNLNKGSACLYYRPKAPGKFEPATGYRFLHGQPMLTTRYREEKQHQDVIEINHKQDAVLTSNISGFLWTDTHTT